MIPAGKLHLGPWCEIVNELLRISRILPKGEHTRILRAGKRRVTITVEVKP